MGLSARMVLVPTWLLQACVVLLGAVTLAVGFVAVRPEPASVSPTRVHNAGAHNAANGLLALPVSARGAVSADLGRQDPRYRVHRVSSVGAGASLRAVNPGQDLSERFSPAGVTLGAGRAHFSLGLAGVGRGTRMLAVPAVPARAVGNRVSYDRGGVREWYVNGPLGLEQGFDVARRPSGSGVLTLAVSVAGASGVRLRGGSALLSGEGGSLRYSGLSAVDARGRALRAWLGMDNGRLLIHVDDRRARYPLRIDPFIAQGEPFAPSGEVGAAAFGYSVALSADGETALIGGPQDNGDTGAAWVFIRNDGVWTQQGPKLTADDESGEGLFGDSVALSESGNTALIGGEGDDHEAGAAWVFIRTGGVWTQQGLKLTASGESGAGLFGESVALTWFGEVAVIGAPGNAGGVGAAWVFKHTNAGWTQETELNGNGEIGSGLFGASVALGSETGAINALIGAPGDANGVGAAWVFTDTGGSWSHQGVKLVAAGAAAKSEQGFSVALSEAGLSRALIGAPGEGAAWVFESGESGWKQEARLSVAGDNSLGFSVAVSERAEVAMLSGLEGGVWEFERDGPLGWENKGSVIKGSASLALSRYGETLLVGGAGTNKEVGFAGVLVDVPELKVEGSGNEGSSQPAHHFALGHTTVSSDGAVELEVEVPGVGTVSAEQPAAVASVNRVGGADRAVVAGEGMVVGGDYKAVASAHTRSRKKKRPKRKAKPKATPVGGGSVLVEPVTEHVGEAVSKTTLTLKPTATALRELARRQTILVPVKVTFVASNGQVSTASTSVGFTRPDYSFESGAEGWTKAWGSLTDSQSAVHVHSGRHSLQIKIHTAGYAALDVTSSSFSRSPLDLLKPGVVVSMWVYRSAGTPPVGFQAMVRVGEEWTECRSSEVRPRADRWVQLSVTVPSSSDCQFSGESNLLVHGVGVEVDDKGGAANGKSVYLDDVSW